MQEAKPLPLLGEDFGSLCEQSIETCLRRVLSVAAQRAEMYHGLAERHAKLVEFIEAADSDDDRSEQ